jgi:hypothetical protein
LQTSDKLVTARAIASQAIRPCVCILCKTIIGRSSNIYQSITSKDIIKTMFAIQACRQTEITVLQDRWFLRNFRPFYRATPALRKLGVARIILAGASKNFPTKRGLKFDPPRLLRLTSSRYRTSPDEEGLKR